MAPRAAIEMALWDIAGKAHGCPGAPVLWRPADRAGALLLVHQHQRPESRDRQEAEAAEGVERGFRTVYIKIGFDIKNDLALARAIKDEVGEDVGVRVDANEAWSIFEATGMPSAASRRLTSSSSSSRST